jgi:putative hydrolase of the HAD superfamily
MIRAVIFDLDNTLVDFMAMKGKAVDAAVTAMIDAGLNLSPADARARIDAIYQEKGIEFQTVFDSLLYDIFNKVDYKILSAGIIAYRRAREAALVPYPHVHLTLMSLLKSGLLLGVVTDAPARAAWLRLCGLGFHHFFHAVVTFDDTGVRKPRPEPFQKALEMLNIAPAEALMVGDWAERDMVGAANLGMKTVFARYGDTFGTVETHADYEVNDVEELLSIVAAENGGIPGAGRG